VARTARRRLLALCLLGGLILPGLAAQAASPVWVVRGPHNTLYLAGSVHLLPAQDSALPPAFDRAYRASSRLVMELDLGKLDPLEAGNWILQHGALPAGTTLREVVGQPLWERTRAAAAELGMPAAMFDGQAPWVVGIELADLEFVRLGLDPQQGVEEQLVARARADGKPTAGLESLDEELGGLAALPRAEQVRMLDQTLDELKETPEQLRDVVGAWRRGDGRQLAALLSHEYASFPALYRELVTARNQRWLPQIEALLREPEASLVVVGSLHLVGEGGLLELLRRDGYKPEQLN
jgi:uncharacterized protein